MTARLLVAALLIFATTVALVPSATAASSGPCAGPDDPQASIRPHKATLAQEPEKVVSAKVGPVQTPYYENDCQAPCPGKPYVVATAKPENALTFGDVAYVGICSLISPFQVGTGAGLFRRQYEATVYGDGSFTIGSKNVSPSAIDPCTQQDIIPC